MHALSEKRTIYSVLGGTGAAFVAFGAYYATKAPGLTFIDSGELAAVCYLPGIAHPTGYPLYTLIGWICIHLLHPIKPIVVLNTLSAIFSCAALAVFSRSIVTLVDSRDVFSSGLQPTTKTVVAWSALTASLLLAFSSVFWSVSLVTEVYALHGLFVSLFILISLKIFAAGSSHQHKTCATEFHWLALLFCLLGFSFSNHLSSILFIPSLVYLLLAHKTWQTLDVKRLLLLFIFFICGISPYLYLPLRAAYHPALNWGNPQTWETFFWHVSGKQYRVWMFSSPAVALQQLEHLMLLIIKAFGVVPLLLVPFGVWYLFHRNRRILWFTLILLTADILYAINYEIHDIDSYYLPVFMVIALWMGSALLYLCNRARYCTKWLYNLAMCGLSSLFLFPLVLNFNEVDQSNNRLVEQYARTILHHLKPQALILSYQWDYFCSPCYYLQLVEGMRRDVVLIEVQLLKRSWYITQLQKNYKALMEKSHDEVAAYSQELYKFEHGLPYDPHLIQKRYMEMINSFIDKNIDTLPIYITCEIEKEIGAGYVRIPEEFVFRLAKEKQYLPSALPVATLPAAGDFKLNDRLHLALRSFYTFMLTSRGLFEAEYGNVSQAEVLLQKALALDQKYPLALKARNTVRLLKSK